MNAVITTVPASAMSFATSLDPVVGREAEIRVQAVPDVVAVEHIRIHAVIEQVAFE